MESRGGCGSVAQSLRSYRVIACPNRPLPGLFRALLPVVLEALVAHDKFTACATTCARSWRKLAQVSSGRPVKSGARWGT